MLCHERAATQIETRGPLLGNTAGPSSGVSLPALRRAWRSAVSAVSDHGGLRRQQRLESGDGHPSIPIETSSLGELPVEQPHSRRAQRRVTLLAVDHLTPWKCDNPCGWATARCLCACMAQGNLSPTVSPSSQRRHVIGAEESSVRRLRAITAASSADVLVVFVIWLHRSSVHCASSCAA